VNEDDELVLRSNLSTRPFYNERIIYLLIALAGVIIFAITLSNVLKVVELSRDSTGLFTRIGHDRAEAENLTREAARIRRGLNQKELTVVAAAAHEANTLIDQRTFSWTAFFNHLEATLPPDVMLVSVRPAVDRGATRVTMIVIGRTAEDIGEFMDKLEATGAFEGILARQTDKTDDGLHRAVLDAVYTPGQEEAKPGDAVKPADPAKPGGVSPPRVKPKPAERSRASGASPGRGPAKAVGGTS
jgi:hypothetical protein